MPVVAVMAAIAILEVLGLAARAEPAHLGLCLDDVVRVHEVEKRGPDERLRLLTEDLLPGGIAALDQPVDAGDYQQV